MDCDVVGRVTSPNIRFDKCFIRRPYSVWFCTNLVYFARFTNLDMMISTSIHYLFYDFNRFDRFIRGFYPIFQFFFLFVDYHIPEILGIWILVMFTYLYGTRFECGKMSYWNWQLNAFICYWETFTLCVNEISLFLYIRQSVIWTI